MALLIGVSGWLKLEDGRWRQSSSNKHIQWYWLCGHRRQATVVCVSRHFRENISLAYLIFVLCSLGLCFLITSMSFLFVLLAGLLALSVCLLLDRFACFVFWFNPACFLAYFLCLSWGFFASCLCSFFCFFAGIIAFVFPIWLSFLFRPLLFLSFPSVIV